MIEAVQEVEVQTVPYSAQYGARMGVHINMVTKSGTNQFHGAAVEFLRNHEASKPLRQNQFGVEFDGPVVIPKLYNGRDKTAALFQGAPASAITGGAIKDPLNGRPWTASTRTSARRSA